MRQEKGANAAVLAIEVGTTLTVRAPTWCRGSLPADAVCGIGSTGHFAHTRVRCCIIAQEEGAIHALEHANVISPTD
jgi:hypothetical protein